jgi:tetratricopeptide (TPR) repeat protein
MRRTRGPATGRAHDDVDAALACLSADQLRVLVREMLLELDEVAHGRIVGSLIARAVRAGSGWAPAPRSRDEVAETLAFATAAGRVGHADPGDVDDHLRRGSGAFLRMDYASAHRIFGALLRPIGDGEIDLGQHELADEVLDVDLGECAAQYVVSAYMVSEPAQRAGAVHAAIGEVGGAGSFWEPIREMERVAMEPLPLLGDFLPPWRALLEQKAGREQRSDWDADGDKWLREVVWRMEGASGLAKLARSTRRAAHLRAWCRTLVDAGDWKAALSAFDEASELVADGKSLRGELLDGAALAAQELGRDDLPARFERAWRACPSMLRLRCWLGSARGRTAIRRRGAEALEACPPSAHRQRAFLHLLQGDFELAAELLAKAPGLGWSDDEHPGYLLFPLFDALLRGERASASSLLMGRHEISAEELLPTTGEEDEPRFAPPEVDEILRHAGVDCIPDGTARGAVLAAMRRAAESRLAGVTKHKRRGHYRHAALLVSSCQACDPSPEAAGWIRSIRTEYRRFPALRNELDRAMGNS